MASAATGDDTPSDATATDSGAVPDSRQVGGEPDGVVQVANLVYAGVKSSQCFSDHFLIKAAKETAISTSRRFHAVKLGDAEIYSHPLLIMTGEGTFQLTDQSGRICVGTSSAVDSCSLPPVVRRKNGTARFGARWPLSSRSCRSLRWVWTTLCSTRYKTSRSSRRNTANRAPWKYHSGGTVRCGLLARRIERHGPHAGVLLLWRQ